MPSGYGQQTPEDSNSDLGAVAFIVRQMMAQMDTMKLVQVVTVHGGAAAIAAAGTVDVLPLVNQIDGATPPNPTPHGTVYGIPWSRLTGGQNAVICDPQANDIGYVVAADRDISVLKTTFAQGNPGSQRRFNIADGIYTSLALNVAPNQYLVFTSTGVRLVDQFNNSIALASSGVTISVAGSVIGRFTSTGLAVTGKITSTGDMVAGSISVQNHLTTGVQSGSALSGPPTG